MATWENEFTTPGSSARIWLVLEVTYGTYDIPGNYTPISWQLRMEERVNASPFNNNPTSSGAASVDGSVFSSSTLSYNFDGTNETIVIASGNKNVTHDADGTKTISVSASYNGGSPLGTASLAGTLTLPTIPRATTPELSASSVDAGVGITISLPRASSSFTHDLSYAFNGGSTVSIATGVATSQAFTPPLSLMNDIPNATSGVLVITVVTKNGATTIGTKTVNLTVTVPTTGVPDFTLTSVTESVAALITMMGGSSGPYIKLNSKPIVTLDSPAGYYGSTIASTSVQIGSQPAVVGSAWTSGSRTATLADAITQYGGTVIVTAIVTDTRGRTKTRTTTINVLDYAAPAATGVEFKRANSGGTDTVLGTYLKIVHSSSVQSIFSGSQKNAIKYRVDYKLASSGSWTLGSVQTPGGLTYATYILTSGFLANQKYDVRLVILDNTSTVTMVTGTLSTAQVALNINPAGTQVGIGKIAEAGRGSLDVFDDAYVRDGARVLSDDDLADITETLAGAASDSIVTPLGLAAYGSAFAAARLLANKALNGSFRVNQKGVTSGATLTPQKMFHDQWFCSGLANLCTNPSAETNTTGWTVAGASLSRVNTWAADGSWSFQLACSGADSYIDNGVLGWSVGKTYTVSAVARLSAALTGSVTSGRERRIVIIDIVAGTVLASSTQISNAAGSTRLSVSYTVPATMSQSLANIRVRFYAGHSAGTMWWDSVMVLEGDWTSNLPTYFDGSVAGSMWAGTAHASISYNMTALPTITFTPSVNGYYITLSAGGRVYQVIPKENAPSGAIIAGHGGTAQQRIYKATTAIGSRPAFGDGTDAAPAAGTPAKFTSDGTDDIIIEFYAHGGASKTIGEAWCVPGSTAVPFVPRLYSEELLACQRHYYRHNVTANGQPLSFGSIYTPSGVSYCILNFPVPMRAVPSAIWSGAASALRVHARGIAITNCTAISIIEVAADRCEVQVSNSSTNFINGGSVQIQGTGSASGYFEIDANVRAYAA